VALPCGSRSTSRIFLPSLPREAERLMAVVVLATPPFWLTMEIIVPIIVKYFLILIYFLKYNIKRGS
jgi:hypothetical protein